MDWDKLKTAGKRAKKPLWMIASALLAIAAVASIAWGVCLGVWGTAPGWDFFANFGSRSFPRRVIPTLLVFPTVPLFLAESSLGCFAIACGYGNALYWSIEDLRKPLEERDQNKRIFVNIMILFRSLWLAYFLWGTIMTSAGAMASACGFGEEACSILEYFWFYSPWGINMESVILHAAIALLIALRIYNPARFVHHVPKDKIVYKR